MIVSRRRFLAGSGVALLGACTRGLIKTAAPEVTHGVQIGDVEDGRALVWARASEPSRLIVEWDTTERFGNPRRVAGPVVTPDGDHAATIAIDGLPHAQTIAVRARFEREAERGTSAWAAARFQMPRDDRFRVAWTGDTCGQGFGRNPEWGGLRGYAAIRAAEPAVFVHSGDLIYADNPILPTQQLGNRTWKNVSNEHVARVAQTIEDYRARFQYNLEDDHVRALVHPRLQDRGVELLHHFVRIGIRRRVVQFDNRDAAIHSVVDQLLLVNRLRGCHHRLHLSNDSTASGCPALA